MCLMHMLILMNCTKDGKKEETENWKPLFLYHIENTHGFLLQGTLNE